MVLQKGDVIMAGPYRFIVEHVKGIFALISWRTDGELQYRWLKVGHVPRIKLLKNAA